MAFQPLNPPPPNLGRHPPPAEPFPGATIVLPLVDRAFAARPALQSAIHHTLEGVPHPEKVGLFKGIAQYVLELRAAAEQEIEHRESKRRKIDEGSGVNGVATTVTVARPAPQPVSTKVLFKDWTGVRYEGISFTVPQRKKLTLEISPSSQQGIRALNAEGEAEFGIPYSDLDHIFRLPIPEKAQSTHNFCAFPRNALTLALSPPSESSTNTDFEPMVWTTSDVLPRGADPSSSTQSATILSTLKKSGISIQEPAESEFASELEQPSRKGETAYHVKGFRGSKEGVLFFLGLGIVWGFKKPLLFFPFAAIESVSYTAVLQRTFNLVVTANVGDKTEEIEFQMLDQADFSGIDTYVKRHQLNDASMAEARKAKRLNINGPPRGARAGDVPDGDGESGQAAQGGEEGESELQKAHREAEVLRAQAQAAEEDDSDDEEEDENFDPGSEGESEGSGTSDEEEGGDGQ